MPCIILYVQYLWVFSVPVPVLPSVKSGTGKPHTPPEAARTGRGFRSPQISPCAAWTPGTTSQLSTQTQTAHEHFKLFMEYIYSSACKCSVYCMSTRIINLPMTLRTEQDWCTTPLGVSAQWNHSMAHNPHPEWALTPLSLSATGGRPQSFGRK